MSSEESRRQEMNERLDRLEQVTERQASVADRQTAEVQRLMRRLGDRPRQGEHRITISLDGLDVNQAIAQVEGIGFEPSLVVIDGKVELLAYYAQFEGEALILSQEIEEKVDQLHDLFGENLRHCWGGHHVSVLPKDDYRLFVRARCIEARSLISRIVAEINQCSGGASESKELQVLINQLSGQIRRIQHSDFEE